MTPMDVLIVVERFFLYWLAYSFAGWVWETGLSVVLRKRFEDRGMLNGPICPIYGFGGLLVVVLLGSFFTILVYYRKIRQISAARLEMNRQLRELNEHIRSINGELRDANNIKDEYVGHYLSLCSRYIVRINDYRKLLLKVYKDGDCDALIRELRTKNPADAEYKEFLAIFDETFLHLFPDFVAHVNRLMTDAERFSPRQPRTLNTELRILALIRLGVTHSAKIAAILNCSVATIHTYRAQLRNAAIGDRNAFDDAIRRIDIAGAEPSQTA